MRSATAGGLTIVAATIRRGATELEENLMDTRRIAEAFSGHRFDEVFPHLAPTVRWVLPGQVVVDGRDAVVEACSKAAAEMADLAHHELVRVVSVADKSVAAVDAVGRYVDPDGSESFVSSADIYEFDAHGQVIAITSYAVEVADAERGQTGG